MFLLLWQQASQKSAFGSFRHRPVRSAEARASSSYRDSSGSISSVEGRSSHPETRNCSSPEPERRLCFHISLVVILGTSWYRFFFSLGENIHQKKKQKKKDDRCLQAEARRSGPWIRGVQCAELQTMQRYTVFDIALTMRHARLTGREEQTQGQNKHTHARCCCLSLKWSGSSNPTTVPPPPPPPPRAPQPCLDVYVEKTLFFWW